MERGVLALPAGPTVLRLLPPLIVSEDQLSEVLDAILEALELSQDGCLSEWRGGISMAVGA